MPAPQAGGGGASPPGGAMGPLVYELGRLSFKQENGVRLPGGLPIFTPS